MNFFSRLRLTANFAMVLGLAITGLAQAQTNPISYHNPVVPGDHPDPSIVRVGNDFWATATSADWGPYFPLLHSTDLVNWECTGSVFEHRPKWAVASFWAPEITEYKGKIFLYYTARNEKGALRVALATADKPGGPYTDHGPIATEDSDSIDPATVIDENGQRYLIWKSDGNSRNLPTAIWAQPIDESGIKLLGKRTALIGNDAGWEGPLVEGPFILKHGDWFYLFYSGSPCCGFGCHYAMGVARSHHLLGPWTKDPANPIMAGNKTWECPGHGSIVTDQQGRYFLLYHSYSSRDSYFSGRQGVLDEVKFGADGWPTINDGKGPTETAPSPFGAVQRDQTGFIADFRKSTLQPGWIWPRGHEPMAELRSGKLLLKPARWEKDETPTALLGKHVMKADYTVSVEVETAGLNTNNWAGVAIAAGSSYIFAVTANKDSLTVWTRRSGIHRVLFETKAGVAKQHFLRITVRNGNKLWFDASDDNKKWISLSPEKDGVEMRDWNAPLQAVMIAGGVEAQGCFDSFEMAPITPPNEKK